MKYAINHKKTGSFAGFLEAENYQELLIKLKSTPYSPHKDKIGLRCGITREVKENVDNNNRTDI